MENGYGSYRLADIGSGKRAGYVRILLFIPLWGVRRKTMPGGGLFAVRQIPKEMEIDMVNEERLRHMLKISEFDTYEDKGCKPMTQYARKDYISLQMIKSFIMGTITFFLIAGLWCLYAVDMLMKLVNNMDYKETLTTVLTLYAVFMLFYLGATYIVYQMKYTAGRRKVKSYYGNLKQVNQMYERDERLKSAGGTDTDS